MPSCRSRLPTSRANACCVTRPTTNWIVFPEVRNFSIHAILSQNRLGPPCCRGRPKIEQPRLVLLLWHKRIRRDCSASQNWIAVLTACEQWKSKAEKFISRVYLELRYPLIFEQQRNIQYLYAEIAPAFVRIVLPRRQTVLRVKRPVAIADFNRIFYLPIFSISILVVKGDRGLLASNVIEDVSRRHHNIRCLPISDRLAHQEDGASGCSSSLFAARPRNPECSFHKLSVDFETCCSGSAAPANAPVIVMMMQTTFIRLRMRSSRQNAAYTIDCNPLQ